MWVKALIRLIWLVLIPRVEGPTEIKNFRPISHANCSYKIVSKVLVNRLKLVMEDMLDESRSAFIRGRPILDSKAQTEEAITYLRERQANGLLIKINFGEGF